MTDLKEQQKQSRCLDKILTGRSFWKKWLSYYGWEATQRNVHCKVYIFWLGKDFQRHWNNSSRHPSGNYVHWLFGKSRNHVRGLISSRNTTVLLKCTFFFLYDLFSLESIRKAALSAKSRMKYISSSIWALAGRIAGCLFFFRISTTVLATNTTWLENIWELAG